MDKADFSEQGAFRWIQKTSMDQRIPKKRLAQAIIAKYGDPKPSDSGER
jgi:response regulator NasT